MTKQLVKNYTFTPNNNKIKFNDYATIVPENVQLITNVTTGTVIYQFNDASKGYISVSDNILELTYNCSGMNSTDRLMILYSANDDDTHDEQGTLVKTTRKVFKDNFSVGVFEDLYSIWGINNDGNNRCEFGGNSSGSSYFRIVLNPENDGNEVILKSNRTFSIPIKISFGISISQRILGQEFFCGIVGVDSNGNIPSSVFNDLPLSSATIVVSSNVGTVTLNSHGLVGGDRISLYNCQDSRFNVGPVIVTAVDKNTFTIPITVTNGTYTTTIQSGYLRYDHPLKGARNGSGFLFENATATNASLYARRDNNAFRTSGAQTVGTTAATQTNTNPYTDAWNATTQFEQYVTPEEIYFRSFASDSLAGLGSSYKISQVIPSETDKYAICIRARNLIGLTKPVAKITNANKSGTTTATIVTSSPHGLSVNDYIRIYGVQDQTNFPNLTTDTVVASVVNSTTFTVIQGNAATAGSSGGGVWRIQGTVAPPGIVSTAVQSVASTTAGVLDVTSSTAWSGMLPGEYVYLYGVQYNSYELDGFYKVLKLAGSVLSLEYSGNTFSSKNTGGAVMKCTEMRLHSTKVLDYDRVVAEITGGRGSSTDSNNVVPVFLNGGTTISMNAIQSTGATGSSNIWNAAGFGGFLVVDVTGPITLTSATSSITPSTSTSPNIGSYAHTFNVVCTAVSGTSPILDVGVEESVDNGTNWVRVYDFPRITTTGSWTSPPIRAQYGTRYRYVQTVGGISPSFTRAINRIQFSNNQPLVRQFIDRSITLTTLNSVTPTYLVQGCERFMLALQLGAATTPPVIQLEGSEDWGTTWYSLGSPLTGVASSIVNITATGMPTHVRARVTTAGATVTPGFVMIKGIGE